MNPADTLLVLGDFNPLNFSWNFNVGRGYLIQYLVLVIMMKFLILYLSYVCINVRSSFNKFSDLVFCSMNNVSFVCIPTFVVRGQVYHPTILILLS